MRALSPEQKQVARSGGQVERTDALRHPLERGFRFTLVVLGPNWPTRGFTRQEPVGVEIKSPNLGNLPAADAKDGRGKKLARRSR